jgi:hypothetical protein
MCSRVVGWPTVQTRVYRYRDPAALDAGLRELRRHGLTPRGLLFVALDPRGETYVAIPEDVDAVARVRVGEKLSLVPPWLGQFYHFDAVHRLPGDAVVWNGDRRLGDCEAATEVAQVIAEWLKGASARNVFLGCASHVPGSWWAPARTLATAGPTAGTAASAARSVALHDEGFVDCVVTATGMLARKIGDENLFHVGFAQLAKRESPAGAWTEVFRSELGAILLVERRVLQYRLVLTCEHGLLEIDVSHLPDLVIETARVLMRGAFGVVGRIDGGAFAVTTGTVDKAGLTNLSPAMLVGAPNQSLSELPKTLRSQTW